MTSHDAFARLRGISRRPDLSAAHCEYEALLVLADDMIAAMEAMEEQLGRSEARISELESETDGRGAS